MSACPSRVRGELSQDQNLLLEQCSTLRSPPRVQWGRGMPKGRGERAGTASRRASILAAALDCFTRRGFDATTIHDIRRAADCSIGSIYHHFGSKEGIAGELFVDGFRRLNDGRMRRLRQCRNAEDGVRTVVTYYAGWVTRQQPLNAQMGLAREHAHPVFPGRVSQPADNEASHRNLLRMWRTMMLHDDWDRIMAARRAEYAA